MLVAPRPIALPVALFDRTELAVFAMVLITPYAIGLVFLTIPLVIIVVCSIMVSAGLLGYCH